MCSLNELGYPLAPTQHDLTLDQKLFLIHAYPIFRDMQQKSNPNSNSKHTSLSERERWKQRTQGEINRKREPINCDGD